MPSLYPSLLGGAFGALAAPVASLHATSPAARGTFRVRRGEGLLARALGAVMRMPAAADRVPIALSVDRAGPVERWTRRFGDAPLCTAQWARGGLLVEQMGVFQCWFRLREERGSLVFEQARATFGLGGVSLPLPRFLWPRVEGRADAEQGEVVVDVRISAPLVGLLVAYDGRVTPEPGP